MNPCAVTTGFFVLGRCGRPSVTVCRCGRPVCGHHVDPQGLCPECAATQAYEDPFHPGWARGYRRHYYQQSSGQYNDPIWYSRFDSYDRGQFDAGDGFDTGGYEGDGFDGDDGNDWVDS
ncbi:hypothetical protein GCM10023195_12330 [Actinoallomurus liliacearum]|uniref:Uncharacterized protein n=1 Tax=Actinoallomurus liliacearum TaxID=1080073 RepID=A0ABP8TBQ0_9ACTN